MQLFRREVEAWEVVEQRRVDPVPTYNEEERDNLAIVDRYDATMCGLYMFELKKATDLRAAVVFAQQRLMQDAAAKGYNVFLTEGWRATHLRKGTRHRAEICYRGRPALATNKPSTARLPPFLAIINQQEEAEETDSSAEGQTRSRSSFVAASFRRWSSQRSSSAPPAADEGSERRESEENTGRTSRSRRRIPYHTSAYL